MLKISSKASIILSLVFSAIFFVLLLVGAVIMPSVLEYFLNGLQGAGVSSPFFNSTFLLLMAYGVLAVAFLADTLLFLLLLRIRAGLVFTSLVLFSLRRSFYCFGISFPGCAGRDLCCSFFRSLSSGGEKCDGRSCRDKNRKRFYGMNGGGTVTS